MGGDAGEGILQAGRSREVYLAAATGQIVEVDVGVGEAGEDEGVAEVDDGRAAA
jgi:hypothetical protein